MIVTLPDDVASTGNPWDAYALAISPTMRAPDDDSWHQDLVYNTMWLLLVERWIKASDAENRLKIQMVLMTGLGLEALEWQMRTADGILARAVKHLRLPLADRVCWDDVGQRVRGVRTTTDCQKPKFFLTTLGR
ncbi:hypothetical protein C8R48DRAFT_713606 [Suillus tomentosus]|nr:hypothetical protein C8R48DRAFT_713606 [Suillus tomentosus]